MIRYTITVDMQCDRIRVKREMKDDKSCSWSTGTDTSGITLKGTAQNLQVRTSSTGDTAEVAVHFTLDRNAVESMHKFLTLLLKIDDDPTITVAGVHALERKCFEQEFQAIEKNSTRNRDVDADGVK